MKKISTKLSTEHLFDAGGIANGAIGAATSALSGFGSLMKTDDSTYNALLGQAQDATSKLWNATSTQDLMDLWNGRTTLGPVTWQALRGGTKASRAMDVIGSTAEGAAAGASAGPWGALAGAVVGLGTGIGGLITGNQKAKKQADFFNDYARFINQYNYSSMLNNASNILSDFVDDQQATYVADGGPIHIAPSKRGSFTAAAADHNMGVQEFASKVLANPSGYSPAMVKKANFARNAAKWHALGGELYNNGGTLSGYGADFSNGLTFINEGGTHELNPHMGVPIGIAADGQPNLVEEGEAIFHDYVYSDRLRPTKELRNKYHFNKKDTYADAVKKISKESEERPNDPISKRGLESALGEIAGDLEMQRALKLLNLQMPAPHANGGHLHDWGSWAASKFPSDFVYSTSNFSDALQDLYNYYTDPADTDTIDASWSDYGAFDTDLYNAFAENSLLKSKFSDITPEQWAKVQESYQKGENEFTREHPTIPYRLRNDDEYKVQWAPAGTYEEAPLNLNEVVTTARRPPKAEESVPLLNTPDKALTKVPEIEHHVKEYPKEPDLTPKTKKAFEGFRYAPAIASGAAALTSIFDRPDYANAARAEAAMASVPDVSFKPVGEYMPYVPVDYNYTANQMMALNNATRRSIMNAATGNAANALAALIANGYRNQVALGDAYMKAMDDNYNRRLLAATFNRETDKTNSTGFLDAAKANQQMAYNKANSLITTGKWRDDELAKVLAARNANLTTFADNLGAIGEDNMARNDRNWLADAGVFGTLPLTQYAKNHTTDEAIKEAQRRGLTEAEAKKILGIKAFGGRLNKRRRTINA